MFIFTSFVKPSLQSKATRLPVSLMLIGILYICQPAGKAKPKRLQKLLDALSLAVNLHRILSE